MAVCNGERFIKEQIDSILPMMEYNDEIVVSYNNSTDSTLEIIQNYKKKDARIHVVVDKGNSIETNFNNAVANCKGQYIFLCDQDDVWIEDKINCIVEYFMKHPQTKIIVSDVC